MLTNGSLQMTGPHPPLGRCAALSDAAKGQQFIIAGNMRGFPITPCAVGFSFFLKTSALLYVFFFDTTWRTTICGDSRVFDFCHKESLILRPSAFSSRSLSPRRRGQREAEEQIPVAHHQPARAEVVKDFLYLVCRRFQSESVSRCPDRLRAVAARHVEGSQGPAESVSAGCVRVTQVLEREAKSSVRG